MEKQHLVQLEKSLTKCLCPSENPLNSKHACNVVIKTYDLKSAERVWTFALKDNLTENCFTAWKFCCLLHKILHEGHTNVQRDSIKYLDKLTSCAQYWSRQKDHMGQCIAWYCKILNTKLLFHKTHTYFKGNLQLEKDDPLWDMNNCFQLCLDMFDYLEDLLHLERVIFANIARHQVSAASKKGMCRLASLATIIAECNLLYQHSVTTLRLLHSQLSPDDISSLSNRFNTIFEELKWFYAHVRIQQLPNDYLVVTIPQLPTILPNLYSLDNNPQEPTAPPLLGEFD